MLPELVDGLMLVLFFALKMQKEYLSPLFEFILEEIQVITLFNVLVEYDA
jgi:hypothetical protein